MDPDESAPVPDAAVAPDAPVIVPPVDDAVPQNDANNVPAESAPEESPVSPANIEITEDPEPVVAPEPESPEPAAPINPANPPAADPIVASAPLPAASPVPSSPPAFDPHSAEEIGFLRSVLGPKAWASHRARTQARLDRIMALARQKGQIDRKDVRDLLNRSKPACTRYLTALVKQGKLTRHRVLDDTVYKVVG